VCVNFEKCFKSLSLPLANTSKYWKGLGLVGSRKDGLWVDYFLSDGSESPYAGSLLGNLRHWLENDEDISRMAGRLPFIHREDICKRQ